MCAGAGGAVEASYSTGSGPSLCDLCPGVSLETRSMAIAVELRAISYFLIKKFELITEKASPVCTNVGAASEYCDSDEAKNCAPSVADVSVVC